MKVIELVRKYESGAITSGELVVDCLSMIDPVNAPAVLRLLPADVLPRLREFIDQYRQGDMLTNYGLIPKSDQIAAAEHWLINIEAVQPGAQRPLDQGCKWQERALRR